jgi:hypothetical protein
MVAGVVLSATHSKLKLCCADGDVSGELVSVSEVRGHRGIGHGLFTSSVRCDLMQQQCYRTQDMYSACTRATHRLQG